MDTGNNKSIWDQRVASKHVTINSLTDSNCFTVDHSNDKSSNEKQQEEWITATAWFLGGSLVGIIVLLVLQAARRKSESNETQQLLPARYS